MPFSVHWMERDVWQLVTSQGTDCTDDEYRLAEKIILRIGPAYEWPRRAILTFAGESSPDSDKSSDGARSGSVSTIRSIATSVNGRCRITAACARSGSPLSLHTLLHGKHPLHH